MTPMDDLNDEPHKLSAGMQTAIEHTKAAISEAVRAASPAPALPESGVESEREFLEWAMDTLHEINVSNYDHDDVCHLNERSVEVILAIKHRLATPAPAPAPAPVSEVDWPHVANEWADMATSGLQWLRNIKDGISPVDDAIANMEGGLARVTALRVAPAPAPAPVDAADQDDMTIAYMLGFERGKDAALAAAAEREAALVRDIQALTGERAALVAAHDRAVRNNEVFAKRARAAEARVTAAEAERDAERERCARIAEDHGLMVSNEPIGKACARNIAAAIRKETTA